jgi:hypothetical protein
MVSDLQKLVTKRHRAGALRLTEIGLGVENKTGKTTTTFSWGFLFGF